MSYLGVGVSPGNVPVYHGSNLKVVDRRVRLAELVLRCLICGLAILAAVLIGSDTQVKTIFGVQKKAKFTDMKALVFLVVANGLAAAYSLVQGLRCVVSMVRGSVLFSKPLAWAIFSCDQSIAVFAVLSFRRVMTLSAELVNCVLGNRVITIPSKSRTPTGADDQLMTYLTLAAVAAAAQSAVYAKLGQPELQWMKICNMYSKFCNQVGEGIASALIDRSSHLQRMRMEEKIHIAFLAASMAVARNSSTVQTEGCWPDRLDSRCFRWTPRLDVLFVPDLI
ncbi:hypothetical protein RJ639_025268 [Escallonia herrerae]|uniref:CASP-like protein n=1 Tax=Escallonia herrerae TaxID=1293975 RepID=A0AA88UXN5_9ASTE|nr:hypothetical protein RJ639_025268 [Escallonia herrerae]